MVETPFGPILVFLRIPTLVTQKGTPGGEGELGKSGQIEWCSLNLFHVSVFCVFHVFSRNTTLFAPKCPRLLSPGGCLFGQIEWCFVKSTILRKDGRDLVFFRKDHSTCPRTCPQRRPKSCPRTTRNQAKRPKPPQEPPMLQFVSNCSLTFSSFS
jgi:hypothetical protein